MLGALTGPERRLRGWLIAHAILSAVLAVNYLVTGDASVFPSSVHVNPQLTVMGMAQYAASRILR